MPKALTSAPKAKTIASAARSFRREKSPIPDRRGSAHSSLAGTRVARTTLSCGQAWIQSRQKVQSMLPVFFGRKRPSSQPCWRTIDGSAGSRGPFVESWVSQMGQGSGSRNRPPQGGAGGGPEVNRAHGGGKL